METGITEKDGVRWRHCGVADAVRAGMRRTKAGVRPLFRCNACLRRLPNADKEDPASEMTCAYFDEKRLYRFWPERALAWMGGRI